ncbi:MAG: hypothetical protein RI906_3745, partial [Pseudomonadota bacterium]
MRSDLSVRQPTRLNEKLKAGLLRHDPLRSPPRRRPEPGGMNQSQNPDGIRMHFVYHPIVVVGCQFARTRDLAGS